MRKENFRCIKLFVLNDPNLLKMLSRAINTSRNFAKYIQVKYDNDVCQRLERGIL